MSPSLPQRPVTTTDSSVGEHPKRHFGLCSALATVGLVALLNVLITIMGMGGCIFFPFYAVPPFLALLLSLSAKASFRRYAWEILITWTPLTMYSIIRAVEEAVSNAQGALIYVSLPFFLFAYTAIGVIVLEVLFRISVGLLHHIRPFFKREASLTGLSRAEALIPQAAAFAENAHDGQTRKDSGDPYFTHPRAVAQLVAKHSSDPELVIVGYLHDTLEDCEDVTFEQLESQFGKRVAELVQSLTNDEARIASEGKVPYMRDKLSHLSPDALFVKLCDTLHNTSQSTSGHQVDNYLKIISVLDDRTDLSLVHRELIRDIRATAESRRASGCLKGGGA